jgi:iron complex transport system substrate-binding protein
MGLAVLELDAPTDIDGVRAQIGAVADAVGRPERGAAMVAELDAKLAAIPRAAGKNPLAAVFQANGVTVGRGSLIDTLIARAGYDNLARRLGIDNYSTLPLEMLIAGQPDLLLIDRNGDAPSLATALLRHPVVDAAFPPQHRMAMPRNLWVCAGPWVADAVATLAAERSAVMP